MTEKTNAAFCLLPLNMRLCGRVTLRHYIRFISVYILLGLCGAVLYFISEQAAVKIFGLGLIFPAAGFFAELSVVPHVWSGIRH